MAEEEKQRQEQKKVPASTSLIGSFNHAINGFLHSFKMERNMRYHVALAAAAIIAALLTHVTRFEMIAIILVIGFVFFAELTNTAMEAIADILVEKKYNELARIAKDVSAGAVLVAAATSVVVGFLVFYRKLYNIASYSMYSFTDVSSYLTLAALILVFIAVVVMKSRFIKKGGTYVQGGMPSGHTAFAFALFVAITFVTRDPIAAVFAAILALIVAESRMETKVHSFAEVVMGALMGVIITVIVFELSNLLIN